MTKKNKINPGERYTQTLKILNAANNEFRKAVVNLRLHTGQFGGYKFRLPKTRNRLINKRKNELLTRLIYCSTY